MNLRRCTQCILPETFPNISFNESGVCNFCLSADSPADQAKIRKNLKKDLEQVLSNHRGQNNYDCIVAFSGGKDSSYTLYLLKTIYNMNCLAITIDNGFIADQAVQNCKTVTDALHVDHIFFKPSKDYMEKMYTTSLSEDVHNPAALKRASSICNSCISLINNNMIKTALQMKIPLIAGGYISGQVPKDTVTYPLNLDRKIKSDKKLIENYTKHFGIESKKYFGIESLNQDTKITLLNPLLAVDYNENEIIETIKTIGWVPPVNTGKNSSNCLLNDLGIHSHFKKFKFNPYVNELADLVRQGQMDRDEALEKVIAIPETKDLDEQMKKLGINDEQL